MEIVINIPEEDYELACKYSEVLFGSCAKSIKNGKPLPKGHGRLIDADKLNGQFGEVMDTVMREPKFTKDVEYILRTTATVRSQIKEADTIIEADKENE